MSAIGGKSDVRVSGYKQAETGQKQSVRLIENLGSKHYGKQG